MKTEQNKSRAFRSRRKYKDLSDPNDLFTKIYVGNLVYDMDEGHIKKLFTKFGKVGKIQIIRDEKTDRSKGIAFLQMYNREHAENAIQKLNGSEVNGRTLKVSVAQERESLKPSKRKITRAAEAKTPKEQKPRRRDKKFDFNFSATK